MCDSKILQDAIESYILDEEKLFGRLDTGSESWYKESVENKRSANPSSIQEPTMNTNQDQTNANTETKKEGMGEKVHQAAEATKGFFGNLWDKHGKFISFTLGVLTCAGAQAGYEAYKNSAAKPGTDGSEQAS